MQFYHAFLRLLLHILQVDPSLVPVFLSKVDLANMYMHVWVCPEYIPCLAFVTPPIRLTLKSSSASISP